MTGIYIQPVGLLSGDVAADAISAGAALPLAGGALAFSAVRLWDGGPGKINHAILSIGSIQASAEPEIKERLDRLIAARAPIAGVSMDRPAVMGIVNVTPDSFSDGGDYLAPEAATLHAMALAKQGADFIDIGGETTKPGAREVPVEEELRRLLPVLSTLVQLACPLSIDTRKPQIMREAAKVRADLINDVSALTFSPASLRAAVDLDRPIVLMHARGTPETMQDAPHYRDVVLEVYDYLESRIETATKAGVPKSKIIADPGIGFGKTAEHNAALLQNIGIFHGLGVPLLVGTSRKRSIQSLTGANTPKEQKAGNIAAALDAASHGVQILRVHDVEEMRHALAVWTWLRGAPRAEAENRDKTRTLF